MINHSYKLVFLGIMLYASPLCSMNLPPKTFGFIQEIGECSKIMGAATLTAIGYGIIQDQITARICLEYFSEGFHRQAVEQWDGPVLGRLKPILLESKFPTIHALIWGTVATWWVGLPFGALIAGASRLGSWPKLTTSELAKPTAVTIAGIGTVAFGAGIYGYFAHKKFVEEIIEEFKKSPDYIEGDEDPLSGVVFNGHPMDNVSAKNGLRFMINAQAHSAAYTAATLGGLGLTGYALYKRYLKTS